ncbi:hypothetical protein [uncultured Lacinutrix sp.]|uniref:hypothetical protein n=1 Tax=uncultured Lacinutrix sp. TaxID=574032 RepID=UPI00261825B1|nr:hypothetical protein [uncultured Lacinutrix sp.]
MKNIKTTLLSLCVTVVVSLCNAQTQETAFANQTNATLATSNGSGAITETFIGNFAGQSMSNGNNTWHNTFIGANSGQNTINGNLNTFIGSQSGISNTSGNENVFLGSFSGLLNNKGRLNTFIGARSGQLNSTGRQNTFLGAYSGENNTTGIGNVFIGNKSGGNINTNNRLFIDNSNTNTPLIYGDFASNVLGINTNNPQAIFHVQKETNPNIRLSDASNSTLEIGIASADTNYNSFSKAGDAIFRTLNGGNMIFSIPGINGDREISFATEGSKVMTIKEVDSSGKVSIGTQNTPNQLGTQSNTVNISNYKLFVSGGILTEELRVRTGWADYVFDKTYKLKSLTEVENYIEKNGHLPNVPSAKTVAEQGIEMGNITKIQQEKIEELTLYTIQQQKEIDSLKKIVDKLLSSK